MKGDLHLHSYYSDGYLSPADVMQKAALAGCKVVSLTDHDTLGGIEEANAAAKECGIINIAGIEISAIDKTETHILGYGFDIANARFRDFTEFQKSKRRERSQTIINNLSERGITFPPHKFDFKVKREISRSHIAAALVSEGYEPDFSTAMNKWLRCGAPAFAPMRGVSPYDAIQEIHAAGGVAVLAHPVRLELDYYERIDFIKRLASYKLDGIEAVYKRSSRQAVKEFIKLAENLGLFVTAGADFHGAANEIIPREQKGILQVLKI